MTKIFAEKTPRPTPPPTAAPRARPTPPAFPVWQTTLAQELGLTTEEVRELREQHLVPKVDWQFDAHNHVAFTVAAAKKLAALAVSSEEGDARRRLLGVLVQRAQGHNGESRSSSLQSPTLPAHVLRPTEVPMTVLRAGPAILNPRIVQARMEAADGPRAAGTIVSVWVRDNGAFRPRDSITGRWDRGLFYHLTSRPPRRVR
jgi:hypothetical protein